MSSHSFSPLTFLALFMLLGSLSVSLAHTRSASSESSADSVKFFVFRADCFEALTDGKKADIADCLKFTISKVLGYAIIAGAGILKVPQIMKIMANKSVHGISKYLFYIEVTCYV